MNNRIWKIEIVIFITALFFAACSINNTIKRDDTRYIDIDTVHSSLFDAGKMWTFDFPPIEYFSRTYGFTPPKEWFAKARLSTLRLPNCTASFISEDGLVMTNHHCARTALDSVNREGENLPEVGFYAATLQEERKAPGIYLDQLLVINDVTDEVQKAFFNGVTDYEKIRMRLNKIQEIQKRYTEQYKKFAPGDSMVFNVVSFYNGGRFSLYGHKRYTDVRLVFAPEDAIAFFGGDPDNFTYPRYDFDCAFFRVYEGSKPIKTSNFFRLNPDGAKEGDAVFVVGNPGSTKRLYTVAQLQYLRDYEYPARYEFFDKTWNIYSSYIKRHPAAKTKYLNSVFSLENSRKAVRGYLDGLCNPILMAKKKDFENKFKEKVLNNPGFKSKFGNPWKDIEACQSKLSGMYLELIALNFRGKYFPKYISLTADLVDMKEKQRVLPDSVISNFYPSDFNIDIETELLAFRLAVMKRVLGEGNSALNQLLAGRSPEQAAEEIAKNCIVGSKEKTNLLLSESTDDILKSKDPLIQFYVSIRGHIYDLQSAYSETNEKLQASVQVLGRALYEEYGTGLPPDATFTLRIADGVVKGYEYNGTIAPPVTTFYGLYDRYYSFSKTDPWKLPERWVNPSSAFRMNTPMNFVSTNDIIGGNSGSPVVNKDLQVVGLIFDGNMESLPGNIIFDEIKNRSVSLHSSAILEGLEKIYNAGRLGAEIRNGKISP